MKCDVSPNNGEGGEGLQNGSGRQVKFQPYKVGICVCEKALGHAERG